MNQTTAAPILVHSGALLFRSAPSSVDYNLTPGAVIEKTGCFLICEHVSTIESMPRGRGQVGDELIFVSLPGGLDCEGVIAVCDTQNLTPTDPYLLAAHNTENPEFSGDYKNLTVWKNDHGRWRLLSFMEAPSQPRDQRRILKVDSFHGHIGDDWFCACVPKQPQ